MACKNLEDGDPDTPPRYERVSHLKIYIYESQIKEFKGHATLTSKKGDEDVEKFTIERKDAEDAKMDLP